MIDAINLLKKTPDCVLIDGNQALDIEITQQTIIKGDSKSAAIAAASILAKVYRDKLMEKLALQYPEYGFDSHMGYASKSHRNTIIEVGPCPIHRKTFLKNVLQKRQQMDLFE